MENLWEKTQNLLSKITTIYRKYHKGIKISSKDKINFLEQFSSLLNSGIPIINTLKIILYQTRKEKLKIFLTEITDGINKGVSLKDSLKKYNNIFTQFDLSIIEMGEVTGKIGDSIEKIKEKEEREKEIKSKIIGALIYPMVIIGLAITMIIVFMVYVVPKVQNMYSDARVNLPGLTRAVIKTSDFLQENLLSIGVFIIFLIIALSIFKKHPKTKIYFDKAILHIPIFGKLIRKKIISLFAGSTGTLLSSGIIINRAIEISSKALENDYYEKEFKKIISGVSKGIDLSEMLGINDIQSGKQSKYFPIELASIVKIGEQTGKLPSLLLRISKKFNKEIDNIVKNISTAIEPIVIILVGIIVGTIVISIMLPFFNMVNVI